MEQELIFNTSMIKRWMFAHVKLQNDILEVQKYQKGIFGIKFRKSTTKVDAAKITDVYNEKYWSKLGIGFFLFGLVYLFTVADVFGRGDGVAEAFFCIIFGLCNVRNARVIIKLADGVVELPYNNNNLSELEKLKAYLDSNGGK